MGSSSPTRDQTQVPYIGPPGKCRTVHHHLTQQHKPGLSPASQDMGSPGHRGPELRSGGGPNAAPLPAPSPAPPGSYWLSLQTCWSASPSTTSAGLSLPPPSPSSSVVSPTHTSLSSPVSTGPGMSGQGVQRSERSPGVKRTQCSEVQGNAQDRGTMGGRWMDISGVSKMRPSGGWPWNRNGVLLGSGSCLRGRDKAQRRILVDIGG